MTDDGALLDSGRDCPRCEDRQVDRPALRHAIAAAVDAARLRSGAPYGG
ncbi:hypothetical protein AB8O64_04870 [Streptomyces sp. QH1-20]